MHNRAAGAFESTSTGTTVPFGWAYSTIAWMNSSTASEWPNVDGRAMAVVQLAVKAPSESSFSCKIWVVAHFTSARVAATITPSLAASTCARRSGSMNESTDEPKGACPIISAHICAPRICVWAAFRWLNMTVERAPMATSRVRQTASDSLRAVARMASQNVMKPSATTILAACARTAAIT